MSDRSFLTWPFFNDEHRALAAAFERWAGAHANEGDHTDVDGTCRRLVRALGAAGLLQHVAPAQYGGARERIDVRTLCLARETLARHSGLADFAFAMQGLGSAPISLFGTEAQKKAWLPPVARGASIAAFAISEAAAGSDVAAMTTAARRQADEFVLDGEKTWISNGGIADHYVVFARTGEAPGAKGLSAFIVPATAPGLSIVERIEVIAPHPLARLRFANCRIPAANLLGAPGEGFKIAMASLDMFRATVGAAALGFARRALDEALHYASKRKIAGAALADLQMSQARLADMATEIDASALLVYRVRLDEGCWRGANYARSVDGQDVLHRGGATRDRFRGPASRRRRCGQGRQGRGAVSRDPRPADIRRRHRSSKDHNCASAPVRRCWRLECRPTRRATTGCAPTG